MAPNGRNGQKQGTSVWKIMLVATIVVSMGALLYLSNHVNNQMHLPQSITSGDIVNQLKGAVLHGAEAAENEFNHLITDFVNVNSNNNDDKSSTNVNIDKLKVKLNNKRHHPGLVKVASEYHHIDDGKPIKGDIPTNGAVPLYGKKHTGGDAIFALATNYPKLYYQRFVGSLRKFGYDGDIVLSVSPESKMKPGVGEYLKETNVVAYGFDVDCKGKDNCKLQDDFLGYPDPRPMRTFANIRYALYEYWLKHYNEQSYILILDFRDTFFQGNPFASFGPIELRKPKYELQVFEENALVKNIGKCVFNSLWVGRCFGKDALEKIKSRPVLCSGSTLGSYWAIHYYVRTMLASMDEVKCWLKGIESDQGYQNYLYYNGHFNVTGGTTMAFAQGTGIVNTIGALNGHRVPKEMKGPLDTHWHARNKEGYIINYDGTKSACIHQWDRWYKDLYAWVDRTVF
jgi:hypothetical protein